MKYYNGMSQDVTDLVSAKDDEITALRKRIALLEKQLAEKDEKKPVTEVRKRR